MSYQAFASCYDRLTRNISYAAMAERLNQIIKTNKDKCELVLDVACGTGSLAWALAGLGYEVIGVDCSPDMLALAQGKAAAEPPTIIPPLFLCQDMCELDLYGTVDVAVCTLDSLNHLENYESLRKALARTALFMEPGGLFIFDVNTEYKHRHVLADNTFVYELKDVLCVWRNALDAKSGRIDIGLDFFTRQRDGRYLREHEDFSEWIYTPAQIKKALSAAQLTLLEVQGEDGNAPKPDAQRHLYITRKQGEAKADGKNYKNDIG